MLRGGSSWMCLEKIPQGAVNWMPLFLLSLFFIQLSELRFIYQITIPSIQYWMSFTTAKISSPVHQAVPEAHPLRASAFVREWIWAFNVWARGRWDGRPASRDLCQVWQRKLRPEPFWSLGNERSGKIEPGEKGLQRLENTGKDEHFNRYIII